METPSTTSRVTRSQASSLENNIPISGKKDDNGVSRSRKGKTDRSVLIDITNDSPIGGLAVGRSETPASSKIKSKSHANIVKASCSGETILRSQVKSMLQKVEEEATENLKPSFVKRPFEFLKTLLNSPAALLAPTPANTPIMGNPDLGLSFASPANLFKEDHVPSVKFSEVIVVNSQSNKSQESPISRALLFDDSPGKSETTMISTITCEHDEEDDCSVWSVEANASSLEKQEEGEEGKEEEYQEVDGGLIDELCEEFGAICVEEKQKIQKFTGKHIRFIYNSDDEIEGEEDVGESCYSHGVLHLKGIPTPKGKHLRFHEEEEEDGEN